MLFRRFYIVAAFLLLSFSLNAQDIVIQSISTTPVTCGGGSDGTISITVTGGNGDLTFTLLTGGFIPLEWVGPTPSRSITFAGLYPKGSYFIGITDTDPGTADDSDFAAIGGPDAISISSAIPTDASCATYTDGDIVVTASGEGGNLLYELVGTVNRPSQAGNTFASLPAGTYDIMVTDGDGCPSSDTVKAIVISEPIPMTAAVDNTTDVSCFGGADGSAEITISDGTAPYTYSWSSGAGYSSTDEDPTGMSANLYTVEVTDNNGCVLNFPDLVTIDQPNDISVAIDGSSDVSCNGGSDGTIQITASNGTPGYTYLWSGDATGFTSTDEDPTGLPADTYDLTITDANTCVKIFDNLVTIGEPLDITASFAITDVSCNGASTGEIDITVSGGTGPYTFVWSGPGAFSSTNEDPVGLAAGSYSVTVTDAQLCSKNFTNIDVDENPAITATFTITDLSCNGYSDGAIDVVMGGGVAPYSYSWSGDNGYSNIVDEDIAALEAANYTLTVTDNAACVQAFPAQAVIEPPAITATVDATTDVSCFGGSDGSAEITPANGAAPYTFNWSGTLGYTSTDEDPTAMPADVYSVTITEAGGCVQAFPDILTIGEPLDMTATLDGSVDAGCFGGSDGSASVTVANGTPGYTYLWTGDATGNTSTSEDPNNLIADTYDLQVTDANTCVKTFDNLVTIGEPLEISITTAITDVLCNGGATGEIDITPSGGTGPYTFAWTGPGAFSATTEDITGLAIGFYNVRVTDINSCFNDFLNIEVKESTTITATLTPTDLTCFQSADGAIDAVVGGGTAPYIYSWTADNGYTNNIEDINGLDAGNYTLEVTDDAGCVQAFPVVPVTEPALLEATFASTDLTCFNTDDGTIDMTITGGTPVYTIAWSGPNAFSSAAEDLTNLEPGDYSVLITDANLCSANYPNQVTITEPADITVTETATDISCFGYDDGSITIVPAGGTPGYTYSWTGPNSFVSTDQDIFNLEPGTYNLDVTDANLCVKTFNNVATLTEPGGITLTVTGQTDLVCFGDTDGTIDVDLAGGTGPFTFSWTNSGGTEVSTDEDPTGLAAEVYSLQVTDANTCIQSFPDAATLTEPADLVTTLVKTDLTCNGDVNGTITASTVGGVGPYEYSLIPLGPFDPANTFNGLSAGTYDVYTRDASACIDIASIEIIEPAIIDYTATASGTNFCFEDSLGSIEFTGVTGGFTPYEYSIDGGANYQSASLFTDLPGGTYPVVVRDAGLCEEAKAPLSINEPAEITFTYTQDDIVTCADDNTGRIEVVATGGTGTVLYSLNSGAGQIGGEFIDLIAGSYLVSMTDDNSCVKDTTVEILAPAPIVITKAVGIDVSGCAGGATGEVDVEASGGTGLLEYSLDGGAYGASGHFTGLLVGTYTVTVRDANGCTNDTTLTLIEPGAMTIVGEYATPATSFGTSTGSLYISISGGSAPYTYTLNPALLPPQTGDSIFNGLPAGDYTVSALDFQGCGPVVSGTITITEPPQLVVDSIFINDITCHKSTDGSIEIYASGGVRPYEFSIDNEITYGPDSIFTDLVPGLYDIFLRDATGTVINITSHTMVEPPPIVLLTSKTDVSPCAGDFNGSITATASGGWNVFEYSIDGINFQSNGDFTGLSAGKYILFTRDTVNCTANATVTINEPVAVNADIVKTDYIDEVLGTITISNPTGGIAPYDYSIDGGATFTATTSYTDLVVGSYDVVVRDAIGCTYQETINILDIVPLQMVINASDVTCYGFDDGVIEFIPQDAVGTVNYSIDDGATFVTTALFENLQGDSTYLLAAYDADGKIFTGSVYIAEPVELVINSAVSPAICNAFSETGSINLDISGGTGAHTVSWSNGSTVEDQLNIVAGTYIYQVSDDGGCILSDTLIVPAQITVDAEVGNDTTICYGESLLLEGTPGNEMLWEPSTYLYNQTTIPNPTAIRLTDSITYIYTVTETFSGNDCYNKDTIHIEILPKYGIEIDADSAVFTGQSLQLGVSTEGTMESYNWIPATGLDASDIADPLAYLEASTTFILEAINDYGCIERDTMFIEVIEDITVYNAFSPNNGDNLNDYFEIENAAYFPDIIVEVFTRWGTRVFYSEGYTDDKRWDGTINGKDAPVGTYYYVIVTQPDAKPITGTVTIIR